MASSPESGDSGRPAGPHAAPPLLQFLHLIWRRKGLIVFGSLLPAVLAAAAMLALPRKYTATFVYEHPIKESEYNVLMRRFHSLENLEKIAAQLRTRGLTACAQELLDCRTEDSLTKMIRLTALPAYPRRLQTTDPATSEKIGAVQAQLVSIQVTGRSRKDVEAIAAVVTDNFEHVLPIYAIRTDLKELIRRFQTMAADIEDNRFSLDLDLKQEQARFDKLKTLEPPQTASGVKPAARDPNSPADDSLVLQFTDVRNTREFLPLPYQIRAVRSKIIDLQETIQSNEDKYRYCVGVLDLTNRLLTQVEQSILTHYTTQQFLSFLGEQLLACKDATLADYLKSYERKTENLVFVSTRAGENPVIYPVPRHVAGISLVVLIASLMVTTFVAVVREYPREPAGRGRP